MTVRSRRVVVSVASGPPAPLEPPALAQLTDTANDRKVSRRSMGPPRGMCVGRDTETLSYTVRQSKTAHDACPAWACSRPNPTERAQLMYDASFDLFPRLVPA